jgi:hypothetical protein
MQMAGIVGVKSPVNRIDMEALTKAVDDLGASKDTRQKTRETLSAIEEDNKRTKKRSKSAEEVRKPVGFPGMYGESRKEQVNGGVRTSEVGAPVAGAGGPPESVC